MAKKQQRHGWSGSPNMWQNPSATGNPPKKGCCRWAEAGKAITRLEFKLAARFIRIDLKHRMGTL